MLSPKAEKKKPSVKVLFDKTIPKKLECKIYNTPCMRNFFAGPNKTESAECIKYTRTYAKQQG
jgi:hypothetical protein